MLFAIGLALLTKVDVQRGRTAALDAQPLPA